MNQKILIIDAHPVYSQKLESFLKGLTFKSVFIAETGDIGVEQAKTIHPDLVIISGILPDMDSRDVCRMIKDFKPDTKIIIQVGLFTSEETLDRFKEVGVDFILDRKEKDLVPLQCSVEHALGFSN